MEDVLDIHWLKVRVFADFIPVIVCKTELKRTSLQTHAVWGSILSMVSDVWKSWKLNHTSIVWFGKSTPSSQPSIQMCPTFLTPYFCLPPPAPGLVPAQQARRVSGTSGRATGDAGTCRSFPCSSPCLRDAWWNEGEAAQPWPRIPDECPLSKAWAVPKCSVIYLMSSFRSLLSCFTCTPQTLDRKSNAVSVWYRWQTSWLNFPGGCYWCIPPSGRIPVTVVVISTCQFS